VIQNPLGAAEILDREIRRVREAATRLLLQGNPHTGGMGVDEVDVDPRISQLGHNSMRLMRQTLNEQQEAQEPVNSNQQLDQRGRERERRSSAETTGTNYTDQLP